MVAEIIRPDRTMAAAGRGGGRRGGGEPRALMLCGAMRSIIVHGTPKLKTLSRFNPASTHVSCSVRKMCLPLREKMNTPEGQAIVQRLRDF